MKVIFYKIEFFSDCSEDWRKGTFLCKKVYSGGFRLNSSLYPTFAGYQRSVQPITIPKMKPKEPIKIDTLIRVVLKPLDKFVNDIFACSND